MKDIFEELAREENGTFGFNEQKHAAGRGMFIWESTYMLKFVYKDAAIKVKHTFGGHAHAELTTAFPCRNLTSPFLIMTRSHFLTLFRRDKNRVQISAKDRLLKQFLETSPAINNINEICKTAQFDPYIESTVKNNLYTIRIGYELYFEERSEVLRPLLKLLKELISLNDSFVHRPR